MIRPTYNRGPKIVSGRARVPVLQSEYNGSVQPIQTSYGLT